MRYHINTVAESQPAPSPVHCEAYPSFAARTVASWWQDEVHFCEWYCEHGGLAAQMDVKDYSNTEMTILYSCGEDTYRHQRQLSFAILMTMQISRRIEPRVSCPSCRSLVAKLFFRSRCWACQHCQRLVERRSLLNPEQKLIVERDRLIARVHATPGPRPPTGSRERARYKLIGLNKMFGDAPPRLERPLRHALKAHWFSDPDDRTDREPTDNAPPYLDDVA